MQQELFCFWLMVIILRIHIVMELMISNHVIPLELPLLGVDNRDQGMLPWLRLVHAPCLLASAFVTYFKTA